MKKSINIFFLGIFISLGAFAQQGELVSIDAQSNTAYYTRNGDYVVELDGSFTGNIVAYHPDGEIRETGVLKKGTKVGTWYSYDKNGNKVSKGFFKGGLKHGDWKIWDGDGNLRIEMSFDEGKRMGEWIFYDAEGKVLQSKTY